MESNIRNIRNEIIENIHLYENQPIIKKLIGKNSYCIDCLFLKRGSKYISDKRKDQIILSETSSEYLLEEKRLNLKVVDKIILHRLGIFEFLKSENKILNEVINSDLQPLINDYSIFISLISLKNHEVGKLEFSDLEVFLKILVYGLKEKIIDKFILNIEKMANIFKKSDFFIILIFAYIYNKNNNHDISNLKILIKRNSLYFKPLAKFIIKFQNDSFIDHYIIKLKKISYDISEVLFLNKIYLESKTKKILFATLHQRLILVLSGIDESMIFEFLKYVFTYSTVLFETITERHLYRVILSYYSGIANKAELGELLEILIQKVDDLEFNLKFSDIYKRLNLKNQNYTNYCTLLEIYEFKNFKDYENFFFANKDSYNKIYIGFTELNKLYKNIRDLNKELLFLKILIQLGKILKVEFLKQISKNYMIFLTEILKNIKIFDENFSNFNKIYWNDISNIILLLETILISTVNSEKKKKINLKISNNSKLKIKLVNTILELEDNAYRNGLRNIVTLKKRGLNILN